MADLKDLIATAQARSVISDLSDDTTLEPKLAALFLGISTKKLEAMRSAAADAGLPFVKMMNPSSKGRNQSIFYKLGDLRDFQKSLKVQSTFDACIKAGLITPDRSMLSEALGISFVKSLTSVSNQNTNCSSHYFCLSS